ncbi:hypothetical protein [Humibacter ginsenosidimutans]|uniref:Uncharacterized protein n=1 Tax=Humibacter ginsenosidimutans TaxID=2599293 RepID=A0A5B8M7J5_9MICO|nr:hypothetical protein [Humibacter ginsenosidimutans]QDZ15974.1 hypothetical protein FPZ11_15415 [Humibacter ginsenosidimutans]
MVITVEGESQTLLELLWIREAWQLHPVGDDLPPELVDTPPQLDASARASAPIAAWQESWPGMWKACIEHVGAPRDPGILDRLHGSELGSDERSHLLRELVGPSWREDIGSEAMTDEGRQWMEQLNRRHIDGMRRSAGESPERMALDALVPAWRRGLTKIVEVPCLGTFTRVIGAHALLVTAETRADVERYRAALAEFA